MTKEELIRDISERTGIKPNDVKRAIEALTDSIKRNMKKKNSIELRGFGTFLVKGRAAKTARDITRNAPVIIPARYVPVFRPSKKFHKLISKIK